MKKLLLDVGNTRIKLMFNEKIHYLQTSEVTKYRVLSKWIDGICSKQKGITIIISCVVNRLKHLFSTYAIKRGYLLVQSREIINRLDSELSKNEEIGDDLLVSSFYLKSAFPLINRKLLINFGTAITITLIESNKVSGVIIAPGISTSLKSINNSTDIKITEKLKYEDSLFGTNTKTCIDIGIVNFAFYASNEVIRSMKGEFEVFISGGDQELFKSCNWAKKPNFVNEIVLKGLEIVSNR
jgi:pantothenate kinase type III